MGDTIYGFYSAEAALDVERIAAGAWAAGVRTTRETVDVQNLLRRGGPHMKCRVSGISLTKAAKRRRRSPGFATGSRTMRQFPGDADSNRVMTVRIQRAIRSSK